MEKVRGNFLVVKKWLKLKLIKSVITSEDRFFLYLFHEGAVEQTTAAATETLQARMMLPNNCNWHCPPAKTKLQKKQTGKSQGLSGAQRFIRTQVH